MIPFELYAMMECDRLEKERKLMLQKELNNSRITPFETFIDKNEKDLNGDCTFEDYDD